MIEWSDEVFPTWLITTIFRPIISAEVPGWGLIYNLFVGKYKSNKYWRNADPIIICDKRYRLYRILDLREWADRAFFFLKRWYDLESQLIIDYLIDKGQVVIDAGANYGHFSLAAASRVGPTGEVFAFEPNPAAFNRLCVHIDLNRLHWISAHNIGLSNNETPLVLSVPVINSGEATFGQSNYTEIRTIECPITCLDKIDINRKVDFLKIDVEGFEVQVLTGGRSRVQRDRPVILTEVIGAHLSRAGESKENLKAILDDLDYCGYRIGLVRRGMSHSLNLHELKTLPEDGDYIWLPRERQAELHARLTK